jgi:hypothetical protein
MLVGIAYVFAILLNAYYLIPMGLFENYYLVNTILGDNFVNYNWLTSLPALFSFTSVSPMPLPGNNHLGVSKLYFSMGIPIILSLGTIIYSLSQSFRWRDLPYGMLCLPILIIFSIALFAVWSPFDFWKYLPKVLTISQFSYRLLSVIMWSGTLLFAFSLVYLFKNSLNASYAFLGIILILLCSSSWISTLNSTVTAQYVAQAPALGGAELAYLVSNQKSPYIIHSNLPFIPVTETEKICHHKGKYLICNLTLTQDSLVELPFFYHPEQLHITVNSKKKSYGGIPYDKTLLVGLELKAGQSTIRSYFQGYPLANWISLITWGILVIFSVVTFIRKSVFSRGYRSGLLLKYWRST